MAVNVGVMNHKEHSRINLSCVSYFWKLYGFFTPIKTNIYPIEYSRAKKKHVKHEFVSFGDAAGLL